MPTNKNRSIAAISAILVTSLPLSASAQSYDPPWLETLRLQLLADHGCVVDYFLDAREGTDESDATFKARAKCEDGRYFDSVRREPDWDFKIEACGAVRC